MKYCKGTIRRVFIMRLANGDRLPGTVESFLKEKDLRRGMCVLVGGIKDAGRIVVGPRERKAGKPKPMIYRIHGIHEVLGVGTIFPDARGTPRLHMHASFGRKGASRTGCIRPGIEVWEIGEVIIVEITGNAAFRKKDKRTGFELLEILDKTG